MHWHAFERNMKFKKLLAPSIVVFLLCILQRSGASKLNVPRILIPVFSDVSTKFLLEATEGGCYQWTTTRSDIIQLTLINENIKSRCSSQVLVSTVTKEPSHNIAVVLAEDVYTKQILRCDVIVDVIHSLSITTTTRELFMEEAPEAFEVRAFDDQGNEFSTLEGIEIDWSIVTSGQKKGDVLRYIKFDDSPYETPHSILELENENRKGYKILLEGVKSGVAKVIARLPQPEYKEINQCEVTLMVVANLLITPAEAYVAPGDVVPFKIYTLNNGKMDDITSTFNAQYMLEPEDHKVASIFKGTTKITALKEGKTRILLKDKNMADPAMKMPGATVYVVTPDYISVNVLPHKNLAILVGDIHDIQVEVYSKNHHRLTLGDNVKINTEISPEFHINQKSGNGTWHRGHGTKPSVVSVHAELVSIENPSLGKFRFDKPIVADVDIVVYPPITIAPSEIILPWDPTTRPKYDIDLVVKGGDGRFIWTSSDHSVGVVSQSGHVRTHSNGFFEVSAAMLRNHHNRETAKFMILPPSKLEIVEFVMETEVGAPVYLHVAVYAEKIDTEGKSIQIPYTQCQELPFQIKQSDPKFKHNRTDIQPPVGISCGNIAMVGLTVGTSKVTVTYYQDGRALEDSVSLSVYQPLEMIQPKSDVVLAVGSSINLIFTGGPKPIIGRSGEHERVVTSDNEHIASAVDLSEPNVIPGDDTIQVRVTCLQLGESEVHLDVANKPNAANCKSQSATITTRVYCSKPRKLVFQPNFDVSLECPMDMSSGNVVIPTMRDIDFDVQVFDDCGHRFLNISSLMFSWNLSPSKAGKFVHKEGTMSNDIVLENNIRVADKAYQTLNLLSDVKQLVVNATVIGYNKKLLRSMQIVPENPPFKDPMDKTSYSIASSQSLYLVDAASIEPSSIVLYNHPGNRVKIPVIQGSGFFEIALSNEDVAVVKYCEATKEIEVIPQKSGELTIQLNDLCLLSKPAMLYVQIVAVGLIRVEMIDKVEIGKCIQCIVRLYDENDNLMDLPEKNMIGIKPKLESKIANVVEDVEKPEKPWGVGEIHFLVSGIEVGETKLVFNVAGGDEDFESAPVDLQVFNPLRIYPRTGTILIKSHMQYVAKGGPQPDANIEFVVVNPPKICVLEINNKGVVVGLGTGTGKVIARAIGMHPTTGQKIVYSEDSVEMSVVPLQGIKLKIPVTRFQVGSIVPLWCFGTPGDISPMILGTIDNPPIIYKWDIVDTRIADFNHISGLFGFDYKSQDLVASRVTGLMPGKTQLHLNVTVNGVLAGKPKLDVIQFSTYVDFEVILPFKFTRPKYLMGDSLLMPPYSEIPLQTNFDGTSHIIEYTLPGEDAPSTEMLSNTSLSTNEKVVTISPNGLLKSYGTLGHAMLIVVATDEYGLKQRISVIVEVKPIHYMMLKVRTNWRVHSNTPLSYIPLGTEFTIKASFQDKIGNKFVTGPLDLKYRTSRCDLIKVSEGPEVSSVQISTLKPGITMIKVWAEGIQNTASYMKLHVEQSVQPVVDHLTAGDIICLYAPLISQYNVPGMWRTSDSNLVEIQPDLDIAFVQNKEGTVVLTHSLLAASPLQIQVLPITEIEYFPPMNQILTNGKQDSILRIPLVLHSEKSVGMKTNNLIAGWRCRADIRAKVRAANFECFARFTNESSEIQFNDLFNITTSIVPETGSYACKFTSLGIYNRDIAILDTDVLMWAAAPDNTLANQVATLKFAPRIFMPQEILVHEGGSSAILEIVGLPKVLKGVTVEPVDPSILYVDEGVKVSDMVMRYEVQLIDYHWRLANLDSVMAVEVRVPLTKQDEKVIVTVVGAAAPGQVCNLGRPPLLNFLYVYKNSVIMFLAMLVVFFLTFYFYSHYMQPVVNVNVSTNRSFTTPNGGRYGGRCPPSLSPMATPSPARGGSSASPCANYPGCRRFNCSCHSNREPTYGDTSTFFANNSDVRRNRRDM